MTPKEKVIELRIASRSMSEKELTELRKDVNMLLSEIKHRLYVKKHLSTHQKTPENNNK